VRSPPDIDPDVVPESPSEGARGEPGATAAAGGRARGRSRKPTEFEPTPGHGKAFERLRLFEQERGLAESVPETASSPLASTAPDSEAVAPAADEFAAALAATEIGGPEDAAELAQR
jgi:hypothetical protein